MAIIEQKHKLFFELVKVSVGTADALSHAPSEEEWRNLYNEANNQTLTGVLLEGVKRLPNEQRPPRQLLMNWHATSEQIAASNRQLNKDTLWAFKKWKQVGYESIILKGQGNAQLYPNPLRRTSGDIDIWLNGDRKEIVKYIKRMFPQEEVTRIEMNFPVKKDTTIEVHFIPSFLYNPFADRKMQLYFREQQKKPKTIMLEDGEISIPNDEMNLVFQLSHIYRHLFYEGIGLRQLMDYYYLLMDVRKNNGENVISNAVKHINNFGMAKFCGALMWVEGEVFGLPKEMMIAEPDQKEGIFLLSEIMKAGNFGHSDDRVGNWAEMNRWQRLTWGTKWALRLIGHYPSEVMWHPVYRITQYLWRLKNGYL